MYLKKYICNEACNIVLVLYLIFLKTIDNVTTLDSIESNN